MSDEKESKKKRRFENITITNGNKLENDSIENQTEFDRLYQLFQPGESTELIKQLQEVLSRNNAEEISMLSKIFPVDKFPLQNKTSHCVRCHVHFDPKYNNSFQCHISHFGDIELIDDKTLRLTCCQKEYDFIDKHSIDSIVYDTECFTGNHTTNKDYVENFEACHLCSISDCAEEGFEDADDKKEIFDLEDNQDDDDDDE